MKVKFDFPDQIITKGFFFFWLIANIVILKHSTMKFPFTTLVFKPKKRFIPNIGCISWGVIDEEGGIIIIIIIVLIIITIIRERKKV